MSGLDRKFLRHFQVAFNSNKVGEDIFDALSASLGAGGTSTDLIFDAATELTIASGAVTATQGYHTLDSQSDAASDDLDTINGLTAGEIAIFRPINDSRTIVVKHNTGNILCPFGKDISLAEDDDFILVVGTGSKAVVVGFKVDSATGGGAGVLIGSLGSLTTTAQSTLVGAINEVDADLTAYLDQLVVATVAAGNGSGVNTATLACQLKRAIDGLTNIASTRQVMIFAGATQYAPYQQAQSSVTFGSATTGSIIDSGNGWALIETDATGAFACTITNTDDETLYFWAETAQKVSNTARRTLVVASNSDAATWN